MKTPGRIWLQFEVEPDRTGTTLCQTAIFDPHGLAGLAYWYALYPIHYLIFDGMLRRIGQAASREQEKLGLKRGTSDDADPQAAPGSAAARVIES